MATGRPDVGAWLDALAARHGAAMSRSEFLKAIRALSARYVERRHLLPDRTPLDSSGKRAAFAGFYAPLHFLTMRAVVRALGAAATPLDSLSDLGCGTGVASIAWAGECAQAPAIEGIDRHAWALEEARRNCRDWRIPARLQRADLVLELERLASRRTETTTSRPRGIVLGWALNELQPDGRGRAERAIHALATHTAIIIVEPIGRRLVPWWDDVAARAERAGARADEWRFEEPLPAALAALDREAGFVREGLTARSVAWLPRR
ncbi:MAG TPA: class I SAM-dependent methyltransferase [Vicinamibacterales bacterium]|nr:class I SAM-dependent methyltransferase [Vicinamibacterales bacterium]